MIETETATQDATVEVTNGPSGLPEAMSVTLDVDTEPPTEPTAEAPADAPKPLPTAVAVSRRLADTLRAAGLDTDVGKLRLVSPVRMRPPIPARRIDILV